MSKRNERNERNYKNQTNQRNHRNQTNQIDQTDQIHEIDVPNAMKNKPAEQLNRDEILEVLRRFKKANADKYKIDSLGLFGSGVRDSRNQKSDIDVVVILSRVDALNLIGIKQDLEEQFSCHVDVVRYREKMNPFLRKRIEKEAIYV